MILDEDFESTDAVDGDENMSTNRSLDDHLISITSKASSVSGNSRVTLPEYEI